MLFLVVVVCLISFLLRYNGHIIMSGVQYDDSIFAYVVK